ncbi:hypothetical protein BDZ89DRAFT_1128220 [Hymenopellis radicata]|nr:hypothetical protein BDZ89DRAFT_1128220 [Hymenopellis radicata]
MSSFKKNRNSAKPYSRPGAGDGQWLHDKAPGVKTGHAPAPARPSNSPSSQLLVSNLHYEVTPADLNSVFGQIGTLVREPHIRYDRSGRSTGTAVISFETAAEATKAQQQFDGLSAKGQPMSISYHTVARRSVSAPTTSTLLNRIQKQPLLNRLGVDEPASKAKPGPIRTKPARNGKATTKPAPKKPKTAEDLDKELEAFMGDAEPAQDVEMAQAA